MYEIGLDANGRSTPGTIEIPLTKVSATEEITAALEALLPDRPLNQWFGQIVREGTGKTFKHEDNQHWLQSTRTIVEAFFHARYFLDMAVRYGGTLKTPPSSLPSGWAGLLYLYDLR